MSKIKNNENQFLGKAEFSRLTEFLQNQGFDRKFLLNSNSFGLFENFFLPEFGQILKKDCFYVRKAGTPYDEVVVQSGVAVDVDANIIYNQSDLNLSIPPDNNWYWIKIKHVFSNLEKGLVSIDQFGNLTGVGTEFTKILRGQPNFPTKIKLVDSLNGNNFEYEVVKVIDDTNCILYGDFNSESDLKFAVVGTFTPGFPVPNDYKYIYDFDSVQIELVQESTPFQVPSYLAYKEFFIARVRNNGVDVVIQDKRIEWYKTTLSEKIENLDRVFQNPLIGVEAVKYDVESSAMDKGIVELSFGFRTESYTIDTSSKKVSILIGNGGVYKSTSDFVYGKFNGWRLYWKNGTYSEIIDSQKSGSQIVLTLDVLIPDFVGSNDTLFIAPPYEEIEIKTLVPGNKDSETIQKFNINTPLCRMKLNTFNGCVLYNFTYRYKTVLGYTSWMQFPDDEIGHYNETSFQTNGELKIQLSDRTQIPYFGSLTNGFIKICENPNSFQNFQQLIVTGDLFGVNSTQIDNSNPTIELYVGRDKRYQHFRGSVVLSADVYINLKSTKIDGSPIREGNTFLLHFQQFINLNGFKLRIVQNFVNPTNYDLVCDINDNDCAYIMNNSQSPNSNIIGGLLVTCTFNDLGKWIGVYSSDSTPKNTVRLLSAVPTSAFVGGLGVKRGYFGWRLMTEMDERFPQGTMNVTTVGQNPISGFGGSNVKTLSIAELPPHFHQYVKTDQPDAAGNGVDIGYDAVGDDKHIGGTIQNTSTIGSGQSFDKRPAFMSFVYIEKIV